MRQDRDAATDTAWRAVRAAAPAGDAGQRQARLTFLGHSTVLIEVDDLRILTDPVLRSGFGPVRRQVKAVLPELFADLDAVFISHGHHDHLDPPSLRGIPGKPTVIVLEGSAAWRPSSAWVRSRRSIPATCSRSTASGSRSWRPITPASASRSGRWGQRSGA